MAGYYHYNVKAFLDGVLARTVEFHLVGAGAPLAAAPPHA